MASVLTWFLVGWTLRPIGALSQQARDATANPLQIHLVAPSPDAEVRLLVDTLNTMLEHLREDTRAKEQFYSAAAHELRTPLAVLSGSIEVVLTRPHKPEEYQETLADLLYQTRRLISLTESLLLLNRLEMGTATENQEPVDVADVCERVLTNLLPGAESRDLKVTVQLADTGLFFGTRCTNDHAYSKSAGKCCALHTGCGKGTNHPE